MCIHVASRWTKVSLPAESQEGKGWFQYMDPNLTIVQIEKVTRDFLDAIEQYPDRVRQKIFNQVLGTGKISANGSKAVPATGAVPGVVNKVNNVTRISCRDKLAGKGRSLERVVAVYTQYLAFICTKLLSPCLAADLPS